MGMYRLCPICDALVERGECPEHPDYEPEWVSRPPKGAAPPPTVPLPPALAFATFADVAEPEKVAEAESLCPKCFRSPSCLIRMMPPEALVVVSRCRLFEPVLG